MIHAFNFSCSRDQQLSDLMEETLFKYCPVPVKLHRINTDFDPDYVGYGNGAGWPQGMLKIKYLKTMSFADDDWVMSVDSDVVFGNPKVFELLDLKYGIIGIQGQQPWDTFYGKWAHMSGCLIFLRGDVARKIASWPNETFNEIRLNHFKPYNITENEDVMLSMFAALWDDSAFDLSSVPGIVSSDFEQDVLAYSRKDWYSSGMTPEFYAYKKNKQYLKSFYHLNYCPTEFLGEKVTGKWDLAGVLKRKGITL